MQKKEALVTLIESGFVFSDEDKLALIDRVPALNDRQVDMLGKYLAREREFVLEHEDDIRKQMDELLTELDKPKVEQVYVGEGKAVS